MSHKDLNNIEELFRSGLEDMEIPVNDAMWSNIASGLSASKVASGTAAATKSTSLLTYLGLTGAAVVVGVVGTLIYTNMNNETDTNDDASSVTVSTNEILTEDTHLTEVTEVSFSDVPATQEDRNIVAEITQPLSNENDPVVNKEEIKKTKTVVVVEEKESKKYGDSWVNYLLTPQSKTYTEPTVINNTASEETHAAVVKPLIAEVQEDEIIASIVAAPVGGYAPLEVSFAHHSDKGDVFWDFGDGNTSRETNPSHIFEKYGKYTVSLTVMDDAGKKHQDFRVIEVMANSALVKIPNVFTPNNDGLNDGYSVEGKNIESFNLAILNTHGDILFQTDDINSVWDGKDKFGEDLPVGTYVVIISAKGIDGKKYEHSGTVTLSR